MARGRLQSGTVELASHYYCTGPIYCFASSDPVDNVSYQTIEFLGTCETYPTVAGVTGWMPAYTNKSGPAFPQDKIYAGREREIVLDLNNYNASALANVAHPPNGSNSTSEFGRTSRLDRGSFLVADDCGFRLWLIFSFWGTVNADAFPDLVPGEFYPMCSLSGDYQDRQGTQDKRHRLVINAQEFRDFKTGGWWLYSTLIQDMYNLHSAIPRGN